jgi:hypothetical protein
MTSEERKAAVDVMASDGPWDCQLRNITGAPWEQCDTEPVWNWACCRYRVRPQPQYCWLNVYRAKKDGSLFGLYFYSRQHADVCASHTRTGRLKVLLEERFDE